MPLPEIDNLLSGESLLVVNSSGAATGLTPGSVRFTSMTLSAAQIIAASTAEVTIIPAPGANKLLVVVGSAYYYAKGSVTFTGGPGRLFYGDPANTLHADVGDNGCLTAASNQVAIGGPNGSANAIQGDATDMVDMPIVYAASTAYASGNGSLTIGVYYSEFNVVTRT